MSFMNGKTAKHTLRKIMGGSVIDGLRREDFDAMWKVAKSTREIRVLAQVEAILFPLVSVEKIA